MLRKHPGEDTTLTGENYEALRTQAGHLIEIIRDVGRQQDRYLFLAGELAQETKDIASHQRIQSRRGLIQY